MSVKCDVMDRTLLRRTEVWRILLTCSRFHTLWTPRQVLFPDAKLQRCVQALYMGVHGQTRTPCSCFKHWLCFISLFFLPPIPTHHRGSGEDSLKVLTWSCWLPGRTQSHSKLCSLCVYFLEFLTTFCDLCHWVAQGMKRSFHFTTMTQNPSPAHIGVCLPGMLLIMLPCPSVNGAHCTRDSGNWIIWVVATNRFPKTCCIKHKRSSCLP